MQRRLETNTFLYPARQIHMRSEQRDLEKIVCSYCTSPTCLAKSYFRTIEPSPITIQYLCDETVPSERFCGRIHFEFDKSIACKITRECAPSICLPLIGRRWKVIALILEFTSVGIVSNIAYKFDRSFWTVNFFTHTILRINSCFLENWQDFMSFQVW